MTIDTFPGPAARPDPFLRTVLVADAVLCAVTGTATLLATGPAATMLGAPEAAVEAVAAVLLAVGCALLWLSRRRAIADGIVKALIAVDLIWVADSLAITALGWIAPTTVGLAVVLAQAGVVLGFAVAKVVALRRGA